MSKHQTKTKVSPQEEKKHKDQIACIYASLLLHDEKIAITDKNISTILEAAKYKTEPYWPGIFANFLKKNQNIEAIIKGGASGSVEHAPKETKKEEKKEEKKVEKKEEKKVEVVKEESGGDMGLGLFGGDD